MKTMLQQFLHKLTSGEIWQMKKIENRVEEKIAEKMIYRMAKLGRYNLESVSRFTGVSYDQVARIVSGRSI